MTDQADPFLTFLKQATPEALMEHLSSLRTYFDDAQRHYDSMVAGPKAQARAIEEEVLARMNAMGLDSLRAGGLTAFTKTDRFAMVKDWPALWDYIRATGNFDLLQKRVTTTTVLAMLDETGSLPPGTGVDAKRTITIRKSTASS
jgi:hypothetical protein